MREFKLLQPGVDFVFIGGGICRTDYSEIQMLSKVLIKCLTFSKMDTMSTEVAKTGNC